MSVLQHECLLVAGNAEHLWIDGAVVCPVPAGIASGVGHAPVRDGDIVYSLVEDTLCCDGEGEAHGQLVVYGQ